MSSASSKESSCLTLVLWFECLGTAVSIGWRKYCFQLDLDSVFRRIGMRRWKTHLLWMRVNEDDEMEAAYDEFEEADR